jgi:hypothetical protein
MTRVDEDEFVAAVRATGNVSIFSSRQYSNTIQDLTELPTQEEAFWFALCVCGIGICPRRRNCDGFRKSPCRLSILKYQSKAKAMSDSLRFNGFR